MFKMEKNEVLLDTAIISIVLGSDCNMNCRYCYQHHKFTHETVKIEYVDRLFKDIYENDISPIAYNTKYHRLDFIGGEPLIYIDLIAEIVELWLKYLDGSKFTGSPSIVLNTNGLLFDTPKVQKFIEKYGYLCRVDFSIDGCKESHDKNRITLNGNGTYDRVWNNFVNLEVPWKTFRWVVDPTTAKYFSETIKNWVLGDFPYSWDYQFNLQSMDWNRYGAEILHNEYVKLYEWYTSQSLDFQSKHPIITSRHNLASIAETVIKDAIICPQTRVCLDSDGVITKCNCVAKVTTTNRTNYGNIMDENPEHREKMWRDAFSYIRGSEIHAENYESDCYHCPIGSKCGACPLSNKSYTGNEYYFPKNACSVMALFHAYTTLFKNQYLYANQQLGRNVKADYEVFYDKSYQIDKPENLLLPKCWALEVMSEKEYDEIKTVTEAVGGCVNPIETKYYTDADLEVFKQEYEKVKNITFNAGLTKLPDTVLNNYKKKNDLL